MVETQESGFPGSSPFRPLCLPLQRLRGTQVPCHPIAKEWLVAAVLFHPSPDPLQGLGYVWRRWIQIMQICDQPEICWRTFRLWRGSQQMLALNNLHLYLLSRKWRLML